ncbi:MAG: hypothetical protein ACXIUL_10235 [Wenzhouxiangella sp.]
MSLRVLHSMLFLQLSIIGVTGFCGEKISDNGEAAGGSLGGDIQLTTDNFILVVEEYYQDGVVQLHVANQESEFEQWKLTVQASDGSFLNSIFDVSTGQIELFDGSVTMVIADSSQGFTRVHAPHQLNGMEIHSTG